MEGLTIDDRQRYERSVNAAWSDESCSNRFLPPGTAGSSNENPNSRVPRDFMAPVPRTLSGPAPNSKLGLHSLLNSPSDTRRDSPEEARRPSPSYWSTNNDRPSLPSLKTVLGASISSPPPRTPSPHAALSRPSPLQTSSDPFPLKPTELYPNKKPRTESTDYYWRPGATDSDLTNARLAFTPREPQYHQPSTKHDYAPSAPGGRPEPGSGFRVSLPPLSTPGSISSHNSSYGSVQPQSATSSDYRLSFDGPNTFRSARDYAPASVLEPTFAPNHALDGHRRASWALDMRETYPSERALSDAPTRSSGAYSPSSLEPELPRMLSSGDARYAQHARQDDPYPPRIEPHSERPGPPSSSSSSSRPADSYSSSQYSASGPAFFMPNLYDAQHGKSRKRSNLPKQSTEIMKRWFEENIANPYPTEEQKLVFSNATGISMTQVSNWFINHRRRCPELRYKRESSRTDRDSDGQD